MRGLRDAGIPPSPLFLCNPLMVWVWQDQPFPVKMDIISPEGKTTAALSNIQLNSTPSESTFQVPSDVQIMDLESVSTGPPSAPPH